MHILLSETDNYPSWISGRERMTVENISWSISTKEYCRPGGGPTLNLLITSQMRIQATKAGSSFKVHPAWDSDIPREKWPNYLQTVDTLSRCLILQCLIWVCTVCQLPFRSLQLQWVTPEYHQPESYLWLFRTRERISGTPFADSITKTYLYNFDPLKPHFYIVKRVYRGIHNFSYFCSKT